MEISIIPGATCAVIRIKIKVKSDSVYTKWKLLYKKTSESTYTGETEEVTVYSRAVYGYGPFFYDLDGLEPNTSYDIKLVIVSNSSALPKDTESSVKTFTTCSIGDFEFKDAALQDGHETQEEFDQFMASFKAKMIAVGYDYKITEERSPHPYNDGTYFSANVYLNESRADELVPGCEAVTHGGYKGTIYLKNVGLSTLCHEYRHFLGLARGTGFAYCYHGDDTSDAGFGRVRYPERCSTISRVAGFTRGIDSDEMEIYMFNGENSVDGTYISDGGTYLGFILLKALGLNDVEIVY